MKSPQSSHDSHSSPTSSNVHHPSLLYSNHKTLRFSINDDATQSNSEIIVQEDDFVLKSDLKNRGKKNRFNVHITVHSSAKCQLINLSHCQCLLINVYDPCQYPIWSPSPILGGARRAAARRSHLVILLKKKGRAEVFGTSFRVPNPRSAISIDPIRGLDPFRVRSPSIHLLFILGFLPLDPFNRRQSQIGHMNII
jgi:hypothetical protein